MNLRTLFTLLLSIVLISSCSCSGGSGKEPEPETPTPEKPDVPQEDLLGMTRDATQLAELMDKGWNLGNTLEAIGGETYWGNPRTTIEMIRRVKQQGFNAVRLPCSWTQYLVEDAPPYTIEPEWMLRVKEVVNYCVDAGLYTVLNIHWDGGWLESHIAEGYSAAVDEKQKALWTQIAAAFRDYDEHLLFAGCNEPAVEDAAQMLTLLRYEQTFIDAVRADGGRNKFRTLVVQAPGTNIDKSMTLMTTLPTDPTPGRMMLEVHYYDPWTFAGLTEDASWGNMHYFWGTPNSGYAVGSYAGRWDTMQGEAHARTQFEKMKTRFVDRGIPVIVGEYGAILRSLPNADAQRGHEASRTYYVNTITAQARAQGLLPFLWDDGGLFTYLKRPDMTPTFAFEH
jgi:aryl-phospho-beta-D-glucosidase BglC (GH1 family)